MEKESRNLEYKERMTPTYLKTVSAFANYGDGEIVFGVSDDLTIVPIEDPSGLCLDIENQINDSIHPCPDYFLKDNGNGTVTLMVKKGDATPYLYKGKAYKRNDTATVEAGNLELKRLVLKGINERYEEQACGRDGLSFEVLKKALKDRAGIDAFDLNILKSLELYRDKTGYNNAAYWLSDANEAPGLDVVVYGDDLNTFKRRAELQGISLISQYEGALEIYEGECVYEKIEGGYRKRYEEVPYEAYREAVANSLIHRQYDVSANGKIEIRRDGIVVSSPGGLVEGMDEEAFQSGSFSLPRNEILARIFLRLRIVEKLGTGIRRIKAAYDGYSVKPVFSIYPEGVSVFLPKIQNPDLGKNEKILLEAVDKGRLYTRADLENSTSLKKNSLIRVLNSLLEKGLIEKTGNGRNTLYRLV